MQDPWILGALSGLVGAVTLVFVIVFAREPWWRHPFGQSVMLLAVAILGFQGLALARYAFGPDYFGREVILGAFRLFVLVAISQRLWVLVQARRNDRTEDPS